ncbi:lactate utilization protein B [Anaeromyxobacter soli]|uniref:lactate utilization protein B n=1 Tax=Anaeromyxobacter soli TaxID=2922725 RepID=UPI001FAFE3DF|nr:lactate utilization protein B [Anaeromyxobacter sp. SG29]
MSDSLPVLRSGGADHAQRAAAFLRDEPHVHWHDQAVWFVRAKRDRAASAVPEWERLREVASRIKAHTQSRLADYLEEFERNATAAGAVVHWARDADEHNAIVHRLLAERGVTRLVKSKSMLTEECHLNPYLEARGIEVTDTDLGERIVQLAKEPPSHIVMPAIHKKKEEIGELFHEKIGTPAGLADPTRLTEAARGHLRQRFMAAQAGLTGVNFAVAETGGIVVCTNEGNADMGTSLPPLHIASMGVEKVIPRLEDLAVFLRLLARSATGQPCTTYTTHFLGPMRGGELHVVVVDNGRSALLAREQYRRALHCIRCAACMNTCPVYRRSGGYSYTYTIPGPIGIVLASARGGDAHASLPFASSLCGSCDDVCPVKIPLHEQILGSRRDLAERGAQPASKRLGMRLAAFVLRTKLAYLVAGAVARFLGRHLPRGVLYARWNVWGRQRELPPMPAQSFRELYRKERRPRV